MKFIWYKNAIQVESGHPMLHGFIRHKNRIDRRPIYPIESRWSYLGKRLQDARKTICGWIHLALEMEELWLATRRRSPLEEQVSIELA